MSEISAWVDAHWQEFLEDLGRLVAIPSVEELDKAEPGAPWGPGPRAALSCALEDAKRFGLDAHDLEGCIGYADLPGASADACAPRRQLGVICHTDVVPAGPGWDVEPFAVTEREGYLLGRGVIDDKGPLMCALYALRYWRERADAGEMLPIDVRMIFGANEETGMHDLDRYFQEFDSPDFLFTPDAEYPVSYGEKGMWGTTFTSAPLGPDARLAFLATGTVHNAVPGEGFAVVRVSDAELARLDAGDGVTVGAACGADGLARLCGLDADAVVPGVDGDDANQRYVRLDAWGKSAHASTPHLGTNANSKLLHYLLDNGLCNDVERDYYETVLSLVDDFTGASWELACEDEHLGALTAVGSVMSFDGGRVSLVIDVRFPTSTTLEELTGKVDGVAAAHNATHELFSQVVPFLTDPNSPEIQALMQVYEQVTGIEGKLFTMGGGTYARHFERAVSFGMEKPWNALPEWAGSMHGPNEAIPVADLKEAIEMYVCSIGALSKAMVE